MGKVAGLDVSLNKTAVCVLDRVGSEPGTLIDKPSLRAGSNDRTRLPASFHPSRLSQFLRNSVAFEMGTGSFCHPVPSTYEPMDRETNIVGALSLVLSDEIKRCVNQVVGASGETASAVIMLGANPNLTAGAVAQALAITPSGVARLIDRLEAEGIVVRRTGSDQRVVVLELTLEGQRLRALALQARALVLRQCMHGVSEDELSTISPIFEKMIQNLLPDRGSCNRFCRMCDEDACEPHCPVEEYEPTVRSTTV